MVPIRNIRPKRKAQSSPKLNGKKLKKSVNDTEGSVIDIISNPLFELLSNDFKSKEEFTVNDIAIMFRSLADTISNLQNQNSLLTSKVSNLVEKVSGLEEHLKTLSAKPKKMEKIPTTMFKTFASAVASTITSSITTPDSQINLMKAVSYANTEDPRNTNVILKMSIYLLMPWITIANIFGTSKPAVFRLPQSAKGPPIVRHSFKSKEEASNVLKKFNREKASIQGCLNASPRPDLSKPELEKYRQSWKVAIQKNNEAMKTVFTVRNLEVVLQLNLWSFMSNIAVFCLTETKLDSSYSDNFLSLNNLFTVIRRDRNKHGGGIAILIRKPIKYNIISIPEYLQMVEALCCDILISGSALRIIVIYNPSHSRCLSVEEMFDDLAKLILNIIDTWIPTKVILPHQPTHSVEIKLLQKKKLLIWRKEGNSPYYKDIAAQLKKSLIKSESERVSNRLNSGSKNFFQFIKSEYKGNTDIPSMKCKYRDEVIVDDESKSELFGSCFSEYFNMDEEDILDIVNPIKTTCTDILFVPAQIELLLSKLKSRNNTSPDNIPAIFLKKACTSLALPLSIIFRESYRVGRFPSLWKTAIVLPLHKKGSRSDPSNYRPISLTSNICKVMEKTVRKHVVDHLTEFELISKRQFGFRNRRSTVSQLLVYQNKLISNMLNGLDTHSIYIDFQRAFDTVPITKLIHKLQSFGISNKLIKWIDSCISNRKFQVMVNGTLSTERPVLSGVPQGSVLGPTLFLLYINCIGTEFISNHLLFADDLKIYSPCNKSIDTDLRTLEKWCDTWKMKVAPIKCEHIIFSHKNKPAIDSDLNLKLNDMPIPAVTAISESISPVNLALLIITL
ncbi:hypothetical protein CRE_05388 [Caenorhabditis remanei]|uniref:Reverse transcriptase domain-containing protein n=1 Tax=Caenorhabditis remanei TaxID=31234 RepID=E3M0A1_CAERE|nr:hypothetical protein CRE_05388 [Caenorhabditis remanei]